MTTKAEALRKEAKLEHRRRAEGVGKRKRPFDLGGKRINEIRRVLADKYGHVLPDNQIGRSAAHVMVHHLVLRPGDAAERRRRAMNWLELQAPWMDATEVKTLITSALRAPRRWGADKLAAMLGLNYADRERLRITTIGAIDKTKEQRMVDRKERKRLRQQQQRAAHGAKPRTEYEAQSATRMKPWKALGMSRASWYRKGKPAPSNVIPFPARIRDELTPPTITCRVWIAAR